tara:strand:+ start:833 stop:2602 length:1770 start_codon:yes stop_codon:yes gene_type:complete
MRNLISSVLLMFFVFNCSKPEKPTPPITPVNPTGNVEDTPKKDENSNVDPNPVYISDFLVNTTRIHNDEVYVEWEKPVYADTLIVKYNIYLDDNLLVENLPEDTFAHVIGCENLAGFNSTVKIEAFDQYEHTSENEDSVIGRNVTSNGIVGVPERYIGYQVTKLLNDDFLIYVVENGLSGGGYGSLRMLYFNQQFNLAQELVINPPAGYSKFGGGLTFLENYREFPMYAAADTGDGIVFSYVGSSWDSLLDDAPHLFKVNYSGDYLWAKRFPSVNPVGQGTTAPTLNYNSITNELVAYFMNIGDYEGPDKRIEFTRFNSVGDYINTQVISLDSDWRSVGTFVNSDIKYMDDGFAIIYTRLSEQSYTSYVSKVDFSGFVEWTIPFEPITSENLYVHENRYRWTTNMGFDLNDEDLSLSGARLHEFYHEGYFFSKPENQGVVAEFVPFYVELNPNTGEITDYHQFYTVENYSNYRYDLDLRISSTPLNTSPIPILNGGIRGNSLQVFKIEDEYIYTTNVDSLRCPSDNSTQPYLSRLLIKVDSNHNIIWQTQLPSEGWYKKFIVTGANVGLTLDEGYVDQPNFYESINLTQ